MPLSLRLGGKENTHNRFSSSNLQYKKALYLFDVIGLKCVIWTFFIVLHVCCMPFTVEYNYPEISEVKFEHYILSKIFFLFLSRKGELLVMGF
jgi:hypothetical protein